MHLEFTIVRLVFKTYCLLQSKELRTDSRENLQMYPLPETIYSWELDMAPWRSQRLQKHKWARTWRQSVAGVPKCMSNLLSLGQVDPQLPPCGEFLPVAEVVGHFFAGIPRHQRRAVLHELVGSVHVGGLQTTRLVFRPLSPADWSTLTPTHTLRWRRRAEHGFYVTWSSRRHGFTTPPVGVRQWDWYLRNK